MDKVVITKKLCKKIGQNNIIKNIDMNINKGEIYALIVRVKVLASFTDSKIVIKYPYKDSLGQYISSKFFIGIL